ncbi:MAG TPA: SusC/RagA family TonB-linked outer membrane protein [Chitinophagaceae bacterium]|nr:SusC/RagA family TonB-linked outer membrane protein [Chitinophagaceae bacterium]
MRKIASLFTMLMLFSVLAFGQNRTISGTVTDEKGDAVPGASVRLKGVRTGVAADNSGKFSILAKTGDVLVVSGTNIEQIEVTVGAGNTIAIQAKSKAVTGEEVIITTSAYGMKKSLRNVSTNTQVVTGEQLNTIRQTNLNNALAGKVSGLQVRSQSSAKLGNAGTGSLRLRGETGFGGGGEPIYVVDGTILPNINDVNMDDVEDLTVLQGPAASAIFGPQGARGAIVITLKKAKKFAKGVGIEVNLGAQLDKVYILPNYQNSYAGGNTQDMLKYTWKAGDPELWKQLDGKYYHDYSDDASWGPRMVGQEYIPWYSWYDGHRYAGTTTSLVAQPNNARDYYDNGVVLNNSVSFSKATDNVSLRLGFNNVDAKGLVPTTRLKKNVFNLSGSIELTKKLTAAINFNYATQILNGEFDDQYSNQTTGSFNQWFHRNLDMGIIKELKDLRTPSGIWSSWNHNNPTTYDPNNEKAFYAGNYWYNFYKWFDLVKPLTQTDRYFGDISLSYQISKALRVKGTYRKSSNMVWSETKYSSDLLESGTQTTGNCGECRGYYGTSTSNANRTNMEMTVNYNKTFNKFAVNATVGTDIFRQLIKGNSANTVNGFSVPNYYAINNSKDQPAVGNTRSDYRYSALFFTGSVAYNDMLGLDLTLRQDWMSDLPPSKPFVASKAGGLFFTFSKLLPDLKWLSFGKLRASIGQIPGGIGTYAYPGFAYGVGSVQWNGNILMGTPDVLVDPNISGFVTTQKEVGIDMQFLKNRVGTSFTYWLGDDKDFATTLAINGASGYTGYLTNAGLITKRGMNFKLMGRPIWNSAVKWELNANWGILSENKVKDLGPGITQTTGIDGGWGTTGPYMLHKVGYDWGLLFGNGIKRINGQPVLDANGLYVNDPSVNFGSVLPKHTFGAQTTVEYKNFILSANADGQIGGKFFSLSDMWGSYSGLTARTATTNDKGNPIRDLVADGGGVHVFGVDANGRPVDYYVEGQDYFHGLYNNRAMDFFVYDLTFIKLREVSLGYNLPVSKISFLNWATKASFSLTARNPVLIYAKTNDFDPSEISNLSGERGNMPGTRGWGFNLKFGF